MNLKDMDAEFNGSAAAEKKDFTPVPDGHYQVKVFACDVTNTKTPPPRPMLKLELEILVGPNKGRKLFKNIMLDKHPQEGFKYLKADLACLGWKHQLSDLLDPVKRATLLDVGLNVNKKTTGYDDKDRPKERVYINSALGITSAVAKETPAARVARASTVANNNDDEPPF